MTTAEWREWRVHGGTGSGLQAGARRRVRIVVTNDLPVESNPYMTSSINANNMFDRLNMLLGKTDIIVALPGYLGTLNEIIMAVTMNYITDENQRKKKPVIVSRKPWEPIWNSICEELDVGKKDRNKE